MANALRRAVPLASLGVVAITPPHDESRADGFAVEKPRGTMYFADKLKKGMGGGQFSKLDKI